MDELLTLIQRAYDGMAWVETRRTVFCGVRSVGYREFYAAHAADFLPECVFVLADYLDYEGETLASYDGVLYRILRTYRTGQALELTVARASLEEEES